MKIKSFAKINLGLRILEKRSDGYHNLETFFKVISLADVLEISVSAEFEFTTNHGQLTSDESNIVVKAIRLLEGVCGKKITVRINLDKNIPIGAGLGGGSSNGAAVLVHLNNLLNLSISDSELFRLGLQLGSDVPFFIGYYLGMGNSAMGKGRGEILEYFDWPLPEKIVLVNPGIHVSTAWAYQNFRRSQIPSEESDKSSFNLTSLTESTIIPALLKKGLFFDNDFEPLVFKEYNKIKHLRDLLTQNGALLAHLSGSGATVFGVFDAGAYLLPIKNLFSDSFCEVCDFV